MSIFANFDNIEEKLMDQTNSDQDEFEILGSLFKSFIDAYSNAKETKKNLKLFCLDGKRLFKINNLFWGKCLEEINDEEDFKGEEDLKKIAKIHKVIENTNLLIELFPDDEFINSSNDEILWEYLESNENKFQILSKDILSFYEEIYHDMNELNKSMESLNDTLGKSVVLLQANLISSQIKEMLPKIKDNYDWFENNLISLKKAIKNTSYSDAFTETLIETLETIVNTFKPFYAKKPLESI